MVQFEQLSLPLNLAIFAVAAGFVWLAGFRISRYADIISIKTGLGHALLGLLLLGGVTSLPELAVTLTASIRDNAALAVNNVLGGVTMQIAVLAVADAAIRHRALTSVVPDSVVLLQGSLNIAVLSLVACAVIVGDIAIFGAGLWTWGILAACIMSFWMLAKAGNRQPWLANIEDEGGRKDKDEGDSKPHSAYGLSLNQVIARAVAAGAVILVAGFLVTLSGEVIAEQTGIGQSFAGAVLVAISTSLPELSTVLSAVRLGLFTLAISDILGTNLFDIALLFVVDLVASGPPVLSVVGSFAAFAAVLGILVTAIFLVGLAERRDRTFLRLGWDSVAVLVAYLGGLVILFTLR
ncbi:MAG: sodium:calcium exchanger [Alphaproteobacteria bacterium BRH_c36]|nr:MAG: sodium:calcium exchanger [Alphaproteobacteria bacterium BRH_c36]